MCNPSVRYSSQLEIAGGETMRHAAVQLAAKLAENRREIGVRVALMQEHRFAELGGDFQLRAKCRPLRRRAPKNCDNSRGHIRPPQPRDSWSIARTILRAARPRSSPHDAGGCRRYSTIDRGARAANAAASRELERSAPVITCRCTPASGRARHDAVTIRCETVMRQIRTDIDQIQAQGGNLIMLSSIAILSAGTAA